MNEVAQSILFQSDVPRESVSKLQNHCPCPYQAATIPRVNSLAQTDRNPKGMDSRLAFFFAWHMMVVLAMVKGGSTQDGEGVEMWEWMGLERSWYSAWRCPSQGAFERTVLIHSIDINKKSAGRQTDLNHVNYGLDRRVQHAVEQADDARDRARIVPGRWLGCGAVSAGEHLVGWTLLVPIQSTFIKEGTPT